MLFLFELYFKTSEALNSCFMSWKLVRANLICICFVTKQLHSASLVFVFFACFISVILKSGTVLDKLSVKKYIYFFFRIQVVIWETIRACYFRSTIELLTRFVFFFNQDTVFFTVGARQSHDFCFNGFLSQAVDLFWLRQTSVSNLLFTQLTVIHFWNEQPCGQDWFYFVFRSLMGNNAWVWRS